MNVIEIGKNVLKEQAVALESLSLSLDSRFESAVEKIIDLKGHLIVMGVGKSGLIGRKISATLASTGTPSFWMHPTEAFHGDLGSITKEDAVLLISYSGKTEELLRLDSYLKSRQILKIATSGDDTSPLAKMADIHLNAKVSKETCPHNLAPTTSTTATLALGDALAVALMFKRGFAPEDFAKFHPGGSLGKAMSTVEVVMKKENLALLKPEDSLSLALKIILNGKQGLAAVCDCSGKLLGVLTDGDICRYFNKNSNLDVTVNSLMTRDPITVSPFISVKEVKDLMIQHKIKAIPVISSREVGPVVGIVDWYQVS